MKTSFKLPPLPASNLFLLTVNSSLRVWKTEWRLYPVGRWASADGIMTADSAIYNSSVLHVTFSAFVTPQYGGCNTHKHQEAAGKETRRCHPLPMVGVSERCAHVTLFFFHFCRVDHWMKYSVVVSFHFVFMVCLDNDVCRITGWYRCANFVAACEVYMGSVRRPPLHTISVT